MMVVVVAEVGQWWWCDDDDHHDIDFEIIIEFLRVFEGLTYFDLVVVLCSAE